MPIRDGRGEPDARQPLLTAVHLRPLVAALGRVRGGASVLLALSLAAALRRPLPSPPTLGPAPVTLHSSAADRRRRMSEVCRVKQGSPRAATSRGAISCSTFAGPTATSRACRISSTRCWTPSPRSSSAPVGRSPSMPSRRRRHQFRWFSSREIRSGEDRVEPRAARRQPTGFAVLAGELEAKRLEVLRSFCRARSASPSSGIPPRSPSSPSFKLSRSPRSGSTSRSCHGRRAIRASSTRRSPRSRKPRSTRSS